MKSGGRLPVIDERRRLAARLRTQQMLVTRARRHEMHDAQALQNKVIGDERAMGLPQDARRLSSLNCGWRAECGWARTSTSVAIPASVSMAISSLIGRLPCPMVQGVSPACIPPPGR